MTEELTTAQRRILEFLELRASEGKTPPTYREICKRFGYRSPKAAADHIAALERKGILVRDKRHARGVSLVKASPGIPLSFGISERSNAFAVRVSGDSMIGRHIFDGDIVLLEHGTTPRKGDIVAALIDNESTLKTMVRKNGNAWLHAENPLYPDLIPANDLIIQGVARAVIRFLRV